MFETIKQTKKEQMLIFILIGAGAGFLLGASQNDERPGDRIVAQAKQAMAMAALIVSKDGKQLATLGIGDGQPAKECHPDPARSLLNPCKAKIGPKDAKGEPTIVSTDPSKPFINLTRSEPIYVFSYNGSYCQGIWRGGNQYESCCDRPGC